MSAAAFIAVDWGTTNRRAYRVEDGAAVEAICDDRGVVAVPRNAFPAEVADLRARLGDLPMLCAGMAGSTRGWVDAAYLPCPAGLAELAAGAIWVEPGRTALLPGLSFTDAACVDVMRGEEVQLLGAVAAGLAPRNALLCQPGTHCKWARMAGECVAEFRTAITGEVFALLKAHSLLGDFLQDEVRPGAAFDAGLALAAEGRLLSTLFGERAAVLLGARDRGETASRVSGLLIGTDVRGQALLSGEQVHILAGPGLGNLYAAAVTHAGGVPLSVDSHRAFVVGVTRIWELIDGR